MKPTIVAAATAISDLIKRSRNSSRCSRNSISPSTAIPISTERRKRSRHESSERITVDIDASYAVHDIDFRGCASQFLYFCCYPCRLLLFSPRTKQPSKNSLPSRRRCSRLASSGGSTAMTIATQASQPSIERREGRRGNEECL